MMATIHPTAVVDPAARLDEKVEVFAHAVIEADVKIGPGTVVRPHAVIRRYTELGANNLVDSFCCLGGEPQDLKFDPAVESYLRIGDGNKFREGVTISRATVPGGATTVGNNTYWMVNSHAGHDCSIGDNVILPNSSLLAGHCTIGRGVILPANGSIHQFTRVGEGVMFQGHAGAGMHIPPFVMCAGVNKVVGLNRVGLRRNPALTAEDREQVKEAFRITYRGTLKSTEALAEMDAHTEWGEAAGKFREFVRQALEAEPPYNRGLCPHSSRRREN